MSFEVLYIRSKQLLRLYFHSGMRRSYISQSLVLTLSPRLASSLLDSQSSSRRTDVALAQFVE
jgi:hypothetical protein